MPGAGLHFVEASLSFLDLDVRLRRLGGLVGKGIGDVLQPQPGRTVICADGDLPLLCRWNADPEVLHYSEGDVDPYTPEDVASIYGTLSRKADRST